MDEILKEIETLKGQRSDPPTTEDFDRLLEIVRDIAQEISWERSQRAQREFFEPNF